MITYKKTFDAINYLAPKECVIPYDPVSNFYNINLRIEEELGQCINEMNFEHHFDRDKSVLISFFGKRGSKIFWKTPKLDYICHIDIEADKNGTINLFCQKYLMQGISGIKYGLLKVPQERRRVELVKLETLMNEKKQNLLILAAKDNCDEVVQNLLECDFDVDDEDIGNLNAMDHAWRIFIDAKKKRYLRKKDPEAQEQSNKIMISLLNANSKFPRKNVKFDFKKCPENVKQFAENCQDLRDYLIGENELPKEFIEKIKAYPNLCYFYDRVNESLLAFAAKMNKIKLIPLLLELDLTLGNHEDPETVFKNIVNKYDILKKPNAEYAKEYPDAHIFTLTVRSKIGNNDKVHNTRWSCVKDAFEFIDKNPICSKILKVVAAWKKLKIYFDFKNNSTNYLDANSSSGTMGIIYSSGYIYIGARKMRDDVLKYEVYGTLIHELCHLAVLLTFMNKYNPYPLGDQGEKFNTVLEESKNLMNNEKIIRWVFDNYAKDKQHSELIVRPMHIMMHYSQNEDDLNEKQDTFKALFSYHKEVFEPLLEKTCKVLEVLQDDRESFLFSDLTEPMQAKILHTPLLFQGVETSLFQMFGNDAKICSYLTKQNMRDILLKYNYKLDIAADFKLNNLSPMIERKIIQSEIIISLDDIAKDKNTKVFILSDIPGSGKTEALGDLACKLKQQNPSYWLTRVELYKCRDHLNNYTVGAKVENFLIDILNIKLPIDEKSFLKLYSNGKVIFIFDGFDEITPKYNIQLLHILKQISKETNNQLWISTRPHCTQQIEKIFGVVSHKFIPCVWDDFERCIYKTEFHLTKRLIKYLDSKCDFNNPLLITIITKLEKNDQHFSTDRLDTFTIFKLMHDKIISLVHERVTPDDATYFNNENIERLHKIYALKLVYEDICKKQPNFKIDKLSIIHSEDKNKKKTPFDKIQRYGFITKSSVDELIKFIHKTVAEFRAIDYLVSIIFGENDTRDEDFKRGFDLLSIIANSSDKHKILSNFLLSGIYTKLEDSDEIDEKMLTQFNENITNIKNGIKESENFVQIIEMWSPFFKYCPNFWQETENENFLKSLLENNKLRSPQEVVKFLNIYFSRKEKINLKMVGDGLKEFNLNLFKLFEEMNNNFDNEEIFNIFKKQFSSKTMIDLMTDETEEKICTVIPNAKKTFQDKKN